MRYRVYDLDARAVDDGNENGSELVGEEEEDRKYV